MGFRVGSFCKIWSIENKGNYSKVQISTSKKNKQTNAYETDFSGFVNFIGHAQNKMSQVQVNDRIKLGDCDVTTTYNKEKKITYTNYALFDFELADTAQSVAANNVSTETSANEEEDTPF